MNEYFIVANSFAAPFFSDETEKFVFGETPKDALLKFVQEYKHPSGLFSAWLYKDANAERKNEQPLAKWHSNAAKYQGQKVRGDLPMNDYDWLRQGELVA